MSETLTTRLDRAIRNGFVGPDAANEMNRLLQEAKAEIDRLEALVQSLRVPSVGFGDAR